MGAGTLILSGKNSYSGMTNVSAGTLQAGQSGSFSQNSSFNVSTGAILDLTGFDQTIGSLAGTGIVALGNNSLTTGANNGSSSFSGDIAGNGGLTKSGTGTFTLTGANSYLGSTTINAGKLVVDGSINCPVVANSGATLSGSGTVGIFAARGGSVIAPGNSIGTLTVATMNTDAGAFYDVELRQGGNTPGIHNDLINVTGLATINPGLTVRVMAENGTDTGTTYVPGTVYTILATSNPGDLTVLGAPAVTDSFAFLDFEGSNDGRNLFLTSKLVTTTFCVAGSNANQCGAGTAVFDLGPGNGVYDAVLGLSDAEVPVALTLLSGDIYPAVTSLVDQSFAQLGSALTQRGSNGFQEAPKTEPMGYVAGLANSGTAAIDSAVLSSSAPTASAWLAPFASGGHVAANANFAALDWWQGGIAGGYEVASTDVLGGVSFGYQRGSAAVATPRSQSALDSFMLGTYGALRNGANTLSGALTLGTTHVATSRTINVGAVTREASADYWTQSMGLSLEARHDLELGNGTTLTPLATLGIGWTGHGGFTETGAGAFNLTAAAAGSVHVDAGLGLALSHDVVLETGLLTLSGSAVWEHSLTEAPSQSMTFAGGNTPFSVVGQNLGTDRLVVGAGLDLVHASGVTTSLGYEGALSSTQQAHGVTASLAVQF